MARYITVCLSLLLLVTLVHAQDTKVTKTNESDTKANSPAADSLNLVTLGLINGKKYAFVDQNCTWFEASYFCNAYGMDLVTIETQNENDLIVEHIVALGMDNTHTFWTAAQKMGRSTWLWLNGENMIFSDWGPGQPCCPSTHHCMGVYYSNWVDLRCNADDNGRERRGIICEERVVATSSNF